MSNSTKSKGGWRPAFQEPQEVNQKSNDEEVRVWEGGSVCKVLVTQALGPEFDAQNQCVKILIVVVCTYNLSVVEDETGGYLGFPGQPACLTGEPQIQVKTQSQRRK